MDLLDVRPRVINPTMREGEIRGKKKGIARLYRRKRKLGNAKRKTIRNKEQNSIRDWRGRSKQKEQKQRGK